MVDTCQAGTLSKAFYSPRIIGVGSSQKGENSYSLGNNEALGVATSDRFTYTLLRQIQNLDIGSEKVMRLRPPNSPVNSLFPGFKGPRVPGGMTFE